MTERPGIGLDFYKGLAWACLVDALIVALFCLAWVLW